MSEERKEMKNGRTACGCSSVAQVKNDESKMDELNAGLEKLLTKPECKGVGTFPKKKHVKDIVKRADDNLTAARKVPVPVESMDTLDMNADFDNNGLDGPNNGKAVSNAEDVNDKADEIYDENGAAINANLEQILDDNEPNMENFGGGANGPDRHAFNNLLREPIRSGRIDRTECFSLGNYFVSVLDHIDSRVERFRKKAFEFVSEKGSLWTSINEIKENVRYNELTAIERGEINEYLKRISSRLSTVELFVHTNRDEPQKEALHQVNILIDGIVKGRNIDAAMQHCRRYLNACRSSDEMAEYYINNMEVFATYQNQVNDIDKNFESLVLGCALDDQKNIKKRLVTLLIYLDEQRLNANRA